MNIYTTPYALQRAGAKIYNVINATFFIANPTITIITCTGNIQVHTIYNGIATTETYSNLTDTALSLKADAETLVRIVGDVTAITFPYDGTYLGSISEPYRLKTIITANCRSLKSLAVTGATKLTSLDLSKNTALTSLECNYCTSITSLDLSRNTELTNLTCSDTGITSLDLSKNTELTRLNCSDTDITSLDLSKNTALTSLECSSTGITSLDLSKNTELTRLNCDNCKGITSIKCNASKMNITTSISSIIKQATSTTGTVTVFEPLTYASTIKTAATNKGWSYSEDDE